MLSFSTTPARCATRTGIRSAAKAPAAHQLQSTAWATKGLSSVLPLRSAAKLSRTSCPSILAAQAASNQSTAANSKLLKRLTAILPIVGLASLAVVPVTMTLASMLKFGAASKTYQGVGNYYDAGIPIAVKAAAACFGMIFGFIHDVGVFLFTMFTSSWVLWPAVVIGLAALFFRD